MPRFSIVIPCYNAEQWLADAIRSCLAQTISDLEVIVVDDGSTDSSRMVAAGEAAADARVRVISQHNQGVGAARNAGLRAASGAYINFLDADDLLEPEKLAVQGAVLDENPGIDLVFCDGFAIDENSRVVMDHITDAARFAGPVPLFDLFFAGGQFPPLVPLVRREAALLDGGFDEDRRVSGWADTNFWLRLGVRGRRYHFIDRRLCRYRMRRGNMSADVDGMEHAAELVYAKLIAERPDESARALRLLQGRLNDQEAALAGLRTCILRAESENAAMADASRVTHETLHAERVNAGQLREQLHDAEERLGRLRAVMVAGAAGARGALRLNRRTTPQLPGRRHMSRIVIFDAGETGRRLWEALAARPTVEIVGFVDLDPRRHGRAFLASPVHPVEWLRETDGWDQVAVSAGNVNDWEFPLASAGASGRRVLELPQEGGSEFLSQLVADVFPDPLAGTAADAPSASGLRIGIFGTGAAGMKVWEALADEDAADAVWFADNNPGQQGREILGLPVIAPQDISAHPFDAVIVASMSRDPICEQLRYIGVASDRILTPPVAGSIDDLRRDLARAFAPLASAEVSA